MSRSTDSLSQHRHRIATLIALTYLALQIFNLDFVPQWTGLSEEFVDLMENISLVVYFITLLIGGWFAFNLKRSPAYIRAAMEDELSRDNARRAIFFSYKIVFLLSVVMFILTKLTGVTARDVAIIMMTAALTLPLLRFAWLESRHD